jgi:hypothetical protein
MRKIRVLVGTRKGAFILTSDEMSWFQARTASNVLLPAQPLALVW